jgi:hypothetical protein
MNLTITGAALALAIALGVLCGWLGGHPPNPFKGPELIPYRVLMLLCAGAAMVLASHLLVVLGVVTPQSNGPGLPRLR